MFKSQLLTRLNRCLILEHLNCKSKYKTYQASGFNWISRAGQRNKTRKELGHETMIADEGSMTVAFVYFHCTSRFKYSFSTTHWQQTHNTCHGFPLIPKQAMLNKYAIPTIKVNSATLSSLDVASAILAVSAEENTPDLLVH